MNCAIDHYQTVLVSTVVDCIREATTTPEKTSPFNTINIVIAVIIASTSVVITGLLCLSVAIIIARRKKGRDTECCCKSAYEQFV